MWGMMWGMKFNPRFRRENRSANVGSEFIPHTPLTRAKTEVGNDAESIYPLPGDVEGEQTQRRFLHPRDFPGHGGSGEDLLPPVQDAGRKDGGGKSAPRRATGKHQPR